MAKMGRPKKDNPKSRQITIRIDEETYQELKSYCTRNNATISGMFYNYVCIVLGNKKDNQNE